MTSIQAVKALKGVLREHLDWNGARLTFLAQFLLALFKVKTVNLAQLATALSGRAKVDSNYKRLQRFFRGFAVDQAVIARLVTRLLPIRDEKWYLTIDRTNWKVGRLNINILLLGIAYKGIAFPLLWTLLRKAGNSNTAERIELMERFLALFPAEKVAALLADREFVGQEWFDYLTGRRIRFRIRVKDNTRIANLNGIPLNAWRYFGDLAVLEYRILPRPRRVWGCSLSVVGMRLEGNEFLIVLTSDSPECALADYARRWEIETLFGCLKTRGFRFEDTHLTDPDRISKMVALLAIAFVWANQTGEWLHQQRPIPLKKRCSVDSSPSSAMALTTCAMSSSI
mgnify:CR=1 FL=1